MSRRFDDAVDYPRRATVRNLGDGMTDRTRRRIATVVLAPVAAFATWAVARLIGIDLVVTAGSGTVGPANLLTAALLGALGGWVAARVLERRSRRPRAWWSFSSSTACAVSMIGPSWLADGSSAVALMAMHLVTAAVVIAGMAGTVPVRRDDPSVRAGATV
jgi:uncharacterized protein DUF6069